MRTSAREGTEFTTDSSDMKEMGLGNRCRGGGGTPEKRCKWSSGRVGKSQSEKEGCGSQLDADGRTTTVSMRGVTTRACHAGAIG
jgi:hypothetical protein